MSIVPNRLVVPEMNVVVVAESYCHTCIEFV